MLSSFSYNKCDSNSCSENEQSSTDNRFSLNELHNLRVLQRNLVYVVGLSGEISDQEVLCRNDFFGRYGRILKLVVNKKNLSTANAPHRTASCYITYSSSNEAERAIKAVDNSYYDGRIIRATYGTTKYCSFYLRGIKCQNNECMYLHSLSENDVSYTKEQMAQNKHQLHNFNTEEQNRFKQRLGINMKNDFFQCTVPDFSEYKVETIFKAPPTISFNPFSDDNTQDESGSETW